MRLTVELIANVLLDSIELLKQNLLTGQISKNLLTTKPADGSEIETSQLTEHL